MKSLRLNIIRILVIIFFTLAVLTSDFIFSQTADAGDEIPTGDGPSEFAPSLPDLSHQYLGSHAADSHGNTADEIAWIAQGAYEEDHQLIPMNGWHSWDPDTGDYWFDPIFGICGSALIRANRLFREAILLHRINTERAWKKLGQSLHMLQDVSTPAHSHADPHICVIPPDIGDCDAYEIWLDWEDGIKNQANTWDWINANLPDPSFDMDFSDIPEWDDLLFDLQNQLEGAHNEYGGRSTAQELWELGPIRSDPVLFRLMFLMAERSDNYNSGGTFERLGEMYNGPLSDTSYLSQMRDDLFPYVIQYSTAWIDYFEYNLHNDYSVQYLPLILR